MVDKWKEDGQYYFQTKGDNNGGSYSALNEEKIDVGRISGEAVMRIPYLGWVKLLPVELKQRL